MFVSWSDSPTRPPKIDRGTRTVKVIVGPEKREFVIHRDPICAASKFFERTFAGAFAEGGTQQVKLPEEEPQVFAYVCDWLYGADETNINDNNNSNGGSRALEEARYTWTLDVFWLKVYQMADHLMIAGLQRLAYESITDTFSAELPVKPNRDFLQLLFADGSLSTIQMYVVEHIAYWLPKTKDKQEWAELFTVHERFGMEMALAIVRSQTMLLEFRHPSAQLAFAELHGLNLSELKAQARGADEKIADDRGTVKTLPHVVLLVSDENNDNTVVKRDSSSDGSSSEDTTPEAPNSGSASSAATPSRATTSFKFGSRAFRRPSDAIDLQRQHRRPSNHSRSRTRAGTGIQRIIACWKCRRRLGLGNTALDYFFTFKGRNGCEAPLNSELEIGIACHWR